MSTFKDLTPQKSQLFHIFLCANAQSLKKDAEVLVAVNKSYSSATSLLVLSLEEAIKGIMAFLHSEGYEVHKSKSISKILFNHQTRHDIAGIVEFIRGIFVLSEACRKVIHFKNNNPEEYAARIQNAQNRDSAKDMEIIYDLITPLYSISDIAKYNDYKKNGLYVDYNKVFFNPKDMILEEEYLNVHKVLKNILKIYQLIRVVHNPLLINRDRNKEVYLEIKKQISEMAQPEYIDELFQSLKDAEG